MSGTSSQPAFPAPAQSCNVLNLLQTGGAFTSALFGTISTVTSQISSVQAQISSIQSLISNPSALLSSVEASVTNALTAQLAVIESGIAGALTSALGSLTSHITAQLSGLIGNLSIAAAHAAAQAGLAGSGGGCSLPSNVGNSASNPCFNMQASFGLLTGGNSSFLQPIAAAMGQLTTGLNTITSTINNVSGQISSAIGTALTAVTSAISTAMATVSAVTSQITGAIQGEIAQLTNMISELLDFSNISTLFGLLNNPCAMNVIKSAATPALMTAITA